MSRQFGSFSVSVVMAAYNAEATIERALESVLNQTLPPDEIIVVDDGSTDRTAEKIRKYEPKVRYLFEINAGPSEARNVGIRTARGEWIAFLDADDEWLPEKNACQIRHLKRNAGLVWTFSNYWICSRENSKTAFQENQTLPLLRGRDYFEDYLEVYFRVGHALTSSVLVRQSVLLEAGLFEAGRIWAEDTDLFFRIAYRYPRIGYLSSPLVRYYTGLPSSLTEKHKGQVRPRCELIQRHLILSAEHGRQQAFLPCVRGMLETCIRRALAVHPSSDLREIPRELESFLPARLKMEVKLRQKWPRAAGFLFKVYFFFKNAVGRFFRRREGL